MDARACVLWNASAGASEEGRELRRRLEERPGTTVLEPGSADETARLAADAARRYPLVVAAGGDGTIGRVAAGVLRSGARPLLALLPTGTANDLCRTLGVPLDPLAALALLDAPRERPLDLLVARGAGGERVIANAITGGNAGRIARELTEERKRRWGPFCYVRGALDVAVDLVPYEVTLRCDGGAPERHAALTIVLANGGSAGGGIEVAPRADPGDGLLDVVVVLDGPPLELAGALARLLAADWLESERVLFRRAREVRLAARPPLPLSGDGDELPEAGELNVRVATSALRVVVAEGATDA